MSEEGLKHHESNPWAKEYEDNQSTKKSDIENMRWKPGEHTIRILPAPKKGQLPFAKYIVHWIPVRTAKKDRPVVHAVGDKCPICKFVSSLWAEIYRLKEEEDMTDEHPEIKKLGKQISKIRGKKTYDMNVIHRGDFLFQEGENKGKVKVKRLVAGPTIWKAIIELGNSAKWGNPSAAGARGYDLTVTVDGEGIKREYTILPDPDRKELSEEELEAVKNRAYNLVKLRKYTTADDLIDILENAKAPLDNINLKKIRQDLAAKTGEKIKEEEPVVANDDEEDQDVAVPPEDADEHEDAEAEKKEEEKKVKKESSKETAAFSADDDSSDDDSSNDDSSDDSGDETSEDDDANMPSEDESSEDNEFPKMDCRGTHDPDDVGCQECDMVADCKKLKKEFAAKAEELGIKVDENLSGAEIEKAITDKEKELKEKAKTGGKAGKAGKSGKAKGKGGKGRDLPF